MQIVESNQLMLNPTMWNGDEDANQVLRRNCVLEPSFIACLWFALIAMDAGVGWGAAPVVGHMRDARGSHTGWSDRGRSPTTVPELLIGWKSKERSLQPAGREISAGEDRYPSWLQQSSICISHWQHGDCPLKSSHLLLLSFQLLAGPMQPHRWRSCSSMWPPRFPAVGCGKWYSKRWKGCHCLALGLVPLPKLWGFKPHKSLWDTRYAGAWQGGENMSMGISRLDWLREL